MKVYVVIFTEEPMSDYEPIAPVVAGVFSTRDKAELYVFNTFTLSSDELNHIGPNATEPYDLFTPTEGDVEIDEITLDNMSRLDLWMH